MAGGGAVNLTTRMFNPDGSIKEGVESVARFRAVSVYWDDAADNSFASNVDGTNVGTSAGTGSSGASVRISYRLPEKWATGQGGGGGDRGDELYFDRTEGVNAKACRRITVFRAAGGDVSESQLERASTVGIAKALRVPDDLTVLASADLVSGRTAMRDDQRYFDFDMAVAPKTCDPQSTENLGLGFCPYESIYLLSATVLDGHLYVMAIESDKSEWKRANSDLKLVRNSFRVEQQSQPSA
jgi:hypothetical protein